MKDSHNNSIDSGSINVELQVNYVAMLLLKEYDRNVKIHSKKQVAKIVQSMKTFGVVTPILVNKDYEMIAGHGRYEALKQLGYEKVPVIILEHLSED
jgi:ParB-like chromosome segregation protein Spo0J